MLLYRVRKYLIAHKEKRQIDLFSNIKLNKFLIKLQFFRKVAQQLYWPKYQLRTFHQVYFLQILVKFYIFRTIHSSSYVELNRIQIPRKNTQKVNKQCNELV